VTSLEATPMVKHNLRRYALRCIASCICWLPLAGHATEISVAPMATIPVKSTAMKPVKARSRKASPVKLAVPNFVHWSDISFSFKEGLSWLRYTTAYSLLPKQGAVTDVAAWNAITPAQFDLEQQLFKTIKQNEHDSLKQNGGLAITRNAQFQGGIQRYWTADDRQEVAVNLGLHVNFR
jgi:hypothetical protein